MIALLIICLTLTTISSAAAGYTRCSSTQYTCADGSCILLEKMCDGRRDCNDGSDELHCDEKLCEKPNWFQCAPPHGTCLSAELVCNGLENCPGGEDEIDCVNRKKLSGGDSMDVGTGGWYSTPRNCTAYEYTCQSDKSCIPINFMCDGKRDCQDDSDERDGCEKAAATCTGFFCKNKKCLESKSWRCDGVNDCGDDSDEQDCTNNCIAEKGKYLCADNKNCIELAKVCDGQNDCPDGTDESLRCKSLVVNCTTIGCPPAAKCQMMPQNGPQCLCPSGFRYSAIQNKCVDIDECKEIFGLCSQNCENTSGGYKCSCDAGYALQSDNKSCIAEGEEGLLLYSTQVTVMGMRLKSKRLFHVARNLTKVIGVAYDGDNIYWTNIQNEAESIVRSNLASKEQEILLTSGLDAPEDLAVDWLTGNIYFSDNVMRHIAVCSNDGQYCVVLVTIDVHQPRGIGLWPQRGQMFWTDWGTKPMIVRASMDGSQSLPIVTENIHWPNGIALDMHNERIYWVDAKLSTMESVRPDGTDRRVVLKEILKHPYGVAVFENNIYWSDWGTKSVHMCNKFTCKDHRVIAKDRTIYAVHIYHSAKQPKMQHACTNSRCSHLCLLAQDNNFTCACPDGMQLGIDQQRCIKTQKKQRLFVGIKTTLLEMEHTTFGRHVIAQTTQVPAYINEMAYNNVNGTIIIADNIQRSIFEYDLSSGTLNTLVRTKIGNISGIAFDHLAYNVYWTDSERHSIEVYSMQSRQRAVVSFFSGVETPIGITLIPEDGFMFVALKNRRQIHIDQLPLNGRGEHSHIFEEDNGDDDIKFYADYNTKTLYWSDSDLGHISFSDYHSMHAYTFRGRLKRPYSIAIVDDDLFWSELGSGTLHWTHKSNLGAIKRVDIEVTHTTYAHLLPNRIPLLASLPIQRVEHPCQQSNGGCSHVCINMGKFATSCLCPAGFVFRDSTNRTCIESIDCEFKCRSGECYTQSRRCNNHRDCPDGSDEQDCDSANMKRKQVICSIGEFMCHNGEQCISAEKRCNEHKDCHDGSDESQCEKFEKSKKCHRQQHVCENGNCVDFSVMCDGIDDCGDNSDEKNCKVTKDQDVVGMTKCDTNMFQCVSGTCIPSTWECDGKIDCTDSSDEHDKCDVKDCPKDMHKCLLGQCIEARLVCDGHNDCGDFSDELNCDNKATNLESQLCGNVTHALYQCTSNPRICLEQAARCNGTAECPRGEDEVDCGNGCGINEFQCVADKQCIRKEFRCDHERDCTDGSDELNCEHHANGTNTDFSHEQPCEAQMFSCRDGKCVDNSRVCNGFPDCDNGSDEGPLCKTACKTSSNRPVCQHKCRPTPTGGICTCFDGYKLDADQRSCVDINECIETNPCAQLCENTKGAYRCSCYPDFMLRQDRTSCKSIESESMVLFTSYNEVRSMTEQPIVLRVAWSANDSKINGFDVNVRLGKAYFTTDSEDVLYMVDMKTGSPKAALSVDAPTKVAVDWVTENVYVISRFPRFGIEVCSFSAQMCGRILTADSHETIKSLILDAFNRKLFHVKISTPTFSSPITKIIISNLDGRKADVLVSKTGGYVTAAAVDPHKQLLYFADMHAKILQAVSYKLGSPRTVQTIIRKSNLITHPSGLTIYENQAYIVNIGNKEAVHCHLYGTRKCKSFNLNILNAEDIVISGASRQPLASNPCNMAKCNGMCIQAEFGYECLCGDKIIAEHQACPKKFLNAITTSSLLSQAHPDQHESSSAVTIIIVLLLIGGLASCIGYLYYRRVKQGHRDLNINLHFQNPLASTGADKPTTTTTLSSNTSTTTASFVPANERMQFGMSTMQRFLRGAHTNETTEISLEVPKQSNEVRAMGTNECVPPNILVEDDSDNEYTRADGGYTDDARARLVS